MLQDFQSPNKMYNDENMIFDSNCRKTPNDRKCSKIDNIMNKNMNENDMVYNEFQSTLFKTKVSNKKSTERQNTNLGNSTGTIRSFGVNLSNHQHHNSNSNNYNNHYGNNNNERRMNNSNNGQISMFYHSGNSNQNTYNYINNPNNSFNNSVMNHNNQSLQQPQTLMNNQDLNLSQHIKSVNIEFNKQKKKILSTEELLIEKIEKEKLEIEKLKKINKENIEKLFPNSTFCNYNTNTINFSSNNQFGNVSFFNNSCNIGGNSNINGFMTNSNFNNSSLFSNSNQANCNNNNSFLTKKRDLYQNNSTNLFTSFTHGLPTKKFTNTNSNNELGIEEDYHSITDNISKLSVLNSPVSEKQSSLFMEKEKEKAKKKEDKLKEIKKHSALTRMNFNIFEKNKF